MDLRQRLAQDLKEAQFKKEVLKISVLRMLFSSLGNKEIEKRTKLSKTEPLENLEQLSKLAEEEVLEVLSGEAKKRREAILAFEKGNRQDLAEQEKKELAILAVYLPQPLSEEEIREFVQEAIDKTGAKTMQDMSRPPDASDMGKVMGEVMIKVKGRADGNEVSRIVKEMLG